MKRMLFETILKGHRLEYIHHIYMAMLKHPEDNLIVVVPEEFKQVKGLYTWPESNNIHFRFISKDALYSDKAGLIKQSFRQTRLLRHYVKQETVESVFLISLMDYICALPFLISPKVYVSGIIYSIYLYLWKTSSFARRLQDVCKYVIMSLTPCLKTVFILNDEISASRFNKLYHTTKFKYIADPYNILNYSPQCIRKELGANERCLIYFHFGGLSKRKGTLDILQAITLLSDETISRSIFVFAGRVYDDIRQDFYQLKKSLPSSAHIIVYDKFCSNELLADLCVSSDFILIPYHETNRSSGLLGYAACYGTPVIGPSDGLMGSLIKQYHLGIALSQVTPEEIANVIEEAKPYKLETDYIKRIQVDGFVSTILDN